MGLMVSASKLLMGNLGTTWGELTLAQKLSICKGVRATGAPKLGLSHIDILGPSKHKTGGSLLSWPFTHIGFFSQLRLAHAARGTCKPFLGRHPRPGRCLLQGVFLATCPALCVVGPTSVFLGAFS